MIQPPRHRASPFEWPREAIDRLHELCSGAALLSARDIAERLSAEFDTEITRNAVCGKAWRMGLKLGGKCDRPDRRALFKSKPAAKSAAVIPLPVKEMPEFPNQCIAKDCRHTRQLGSKLCAEHLAEALRDTNTRKGTWEGFGGGQSSLG